MSDIQEEQKRLYKKAEENDIKFTDEYVLKLQKENEKLHKELDYADNYNIYLIAKLDKIKEYINHTQNYGTMAQVMPHLKPYVNGDDILELLEEIE